VSEQRDEDVKWVLGRAFGAEPPLGLDRAEILRAGRRKVRNRRIVASGGVAASVIAVVVGAAVLPGLLTDDGPGEDVAVGTSTSAPSVSGTPPTTGQSAPVGPSLPLTTVTMAPNEVHAEVLTATVAGAVVLSQFRLTTASDGSTLPLAFVHHRAGYRAAADLADGDGAGYLQIEVNYAPDGSTAVCEPSSDQVMVHCGIDMGSGYPITLTTRTAKSGRLEYIARGIRNETEVVVMATNVASRNPLGRPVTRMFPPLDLEVLHRLASTPGLDYR
jgi:hypothetical protein